jgi:spore germination protein YaaH
VVLPPATAAPAAAPAALIDAPPIAPRENFAFAPYWTLPESGGFSLSGLTTLDYFSIGVNANGTLDESGPGWNGYQSQALADLITRAHGAGERVVLTVNDFDQGSLNALTSSPTAPKTLAAALIPVLRAKNLDGVNFDFEGQGSGDQAGLTNLISIVSWTLRATDPHWQVTMDTYSSSAGDPGGFYNIAALADSVDAFFVMEYNQNLEGSQNAASSLTSGQFSDLTTLEQYTAVVSPSKVILGTPFFGIDWPTTDGTMGATSTGGATDIPDSQVQSSGDPPYWDPVTDAGWTSYQVGTQWHDSYWENPYGLYLVSQLAAHYGVRGVGIWALGMEDDDAQMISALNGIAPAGGAGDTGPQSTSASTTTTTAPAPGATTTTPGGASTTTSTTTPPAPTTTTTAPPFITGTVNGKTVNLTPATAAAAQPALPIGGTLTNFATNEPAYACLVGGPPLTIYSSLNGSLEVVEASTTDTTPPDCMTQDFTFPT